MILSYLALLAVSAQLPKASADDDMTLVGTWSSKSNTVFTGPGFYDPVDELLIEPALPGISYSFTEDGYFEEATYQVSGNPQNHSCPTAVLVYQHGKYEVLTNGSILMTPIEVDGRQLLSQPCNDGGVSVYSRYSQVELFKEYELLIDPYHGRYRLNLYEWDGTPVQPLYLAYRPPMMLPTETLNPTSGANSTSNSSSTNEKRSLKQRIKRSLENKKRTNAVIVSKFDHDFYWWGSVLLLGAGSLGYLLL